MATNATNRLRQQLTGHRSEVMREVVDLKTAQECNQQKTEARLDEIAQKVNALGAAAGAPVPNLPIESGASRGKRGSAAETPGPLPEALPQRSSCTELCPKQALAVTSFGNSFAGFSVRSV